LPRGLHLLARNRRILQAQHTAFRLGSCAKQLRGWKKCAVWLQLPVQHKHITSTSTSSLLAQRVNVIYGSRKLQKCCHKCDLGNNSFCLYEMLLVFHKIEDLIFRHLFFYLHIACLIIMFQ